ncbi:MAG: hydrogenase formation protein HypD [Candidatus Bathyarchaeia archaeon]
METFRFRDRDLALKIVGKIKEYGVKATFMHVCGTHQDTLLRYGLDSLLERVNVKVKAGPGCPVCVTPPEEYEEAITLAEKGVVITGYGDVLKSPGYDRSLLDMRAKGCDVRIVYSVSDAVNIALKTGKEVVFMGVGFETTAPSTASTIINSPPENFSILSCHRYIPPAVQKLLSMGELKLDGLIQPGHVSTIIGLTPYERLLKEFNIPQVIAGFEPLDVLMAVLMLVKQIYEGPPRVENEYVRSVKPEGNLKALNMINQVFYPIKVHWRGFPEIEKSGMKLKPEYEKYDARLKFEDSIGDLSSGEFGKPKGCLCGEVLRGIADPEECPLFSVRCTPQSPVGPCMVSIEGTCHIEYRYKKRCKQVKR